MTDNQLETALRPVLRQALAEQGLIPDSNDGDPEPGEFSDADLPRFRSYFGPSADGTYPGHVHTFFSVSPKRFAAATGLRLQQANGRSVWL